MIRLGAEEQIRQYFNFGWKVIRLERHSKKPRDKGWNKNWKSQEAIIEWFDAGENIGVQVGKDSDWLCCVDLDAPEAVKLAPYFLPDTLKAGKEGDGVATHYVYRSEGADYIKIADGAEELLSLKASATGAGHQFVVEPSVHAKKGRYLWFPFFNPAAKADVGGERLEEVFRQLGISTLLLRRLPADGRHEFSLAVAGTLLRRGYDTEKLARIFEVVWTVAGAPQDGVKHAVKNVEDTASRIADNDPIKADGALEDISKGLLRSLLSAADLRQSRGFGQEEGASEPTRPDDDELARQWLYRHQDIRSNPHGWAHYSGGYWQRVEDALISQSVTRYLSRTAGVRVTANKVSSITKLASHHSYVKGDLWDARDDIVVCKNGTLDLNTFKLRDHRREDYALGGLPWNYDPTFKAEAWEKHLGERLGDVWPFLQEFAGYALTTHTDYEICLWLLGEGGTGKSTFVEGLMAICGPRAGRLGLSDIERSSFALENITGKTLLTATEQPSTFIKQVDLINTLISGEVISINRKHRSIVEERSNAKILWAMNAEPKIREEGTGLFRRIKIVKFPKLEGPPNPTVKQRIMGIEPPGILNWAIEGLKRVREREGFDIPDSVRSAVAEFEYNNDPPRQFVDEVCVTGPQYTTTVDFLYEKYVEWCEDSGYKPKNKQQLGQDWKRLGFEPCRKNSERLWTGVTFRGKIL